MLTRNSYLANAILGGMPGLMIACLLYAAMTWCSHALMPSIQLEGSMGICLPSPNQWQLASGLNIGLSAAITALCVLLAIALNARFSIIPGTGMMYATIFLIATGSVPWLTQRLSSSIILLAGTLVCTHLLFSLYGRKNPAQGIFVIFSLLAWGSMIQYAFVLMMPIFMLGAIFLGVFRFKGFVAAVMGIAAPYWILLGLGVITPDDFEMPELTNLLTSFAAPDSLFFLLVGQGFTALLTLLLTASNALAPSTTGQQHRSYMAFINLLGIAMIWFILFDSTNMLSYMGLLALCLGWQAAGYAAIPRHKFAYLPVIIAIPVFITLFILTLIY